MKTHVHVHIHEPLKLYRVLKYCSIFVLKLCTQQVSFQLLQLCCLETASRNFILCFYWKTINSNSNIFLAGKKNRNRKICNRKISNKPFRFTCWLNGNLVIFLNEKRSCFSFIRTVTVLRRKTEHCAITPNFIQNTFRWIWRPN